jgi:hypothetical protein
VLIYKIPCAIHSALAGYLFVLWPWVTQRMTSRALKAGLLLTGCEAKLLLASIFVIVSSSAAGRFTQNGSVSAITFESLWHRDCTLSQREKFPARRKNHGNRKPHKIVKAGLESRCFSWTGGCSRCATFPLFALFFLFRFRIKSPSRG